jgi:hypothetical protein
MTALQLYKYVTDNGIEWHWHNHDGEQDVILLPYIMHLEEFNDLLSNGIFDDAGIEITMWKGYVGIWMLDICEYYGIKLEEVFPGDAEKEG